MNSQLTRKAYYFTETDFAAIAAIRERYGLSSDSDCIRLALRMLADPTAIKIAVSPQAVKRQTKRARS